MTYICNIFCLLVSLQEFLEGRKWHGEIVGLTSNELEVYGRNETSFTRINGNQML